MEQLGMKYTPHECKYTGNIKLSNAGVDKLRRKYILGQKTDQDIKE